MILPLELLRTISYYCKPYLLAVDHTTLKIYDTEWLQKMGYYELYQRWLLTGDIYELRYDKKYAYDVRGNYKLVSNTLVSTTFLGRGIKATAGGVILTYNGTLYKSPISSKLAEDLVEDFTEETNQVQTVTGVVDIAQDIYVTADRCYYQGGYMYLEPNSFGRETAEPFLGVVANDNTCAYSRDMIYVIEPNRNSNNTKYIILHLVACPKLVRNIIYYVNGLHVLCEDNCLYRVAGLNSDAIESEDSDESDNESDNESDDSESDEEPTLSGNSMATNKVFLHRGGRLKLVLSDIQAIFESIAVKLDGTILIYHKYKKDQYLWKQLDWKPQGVIQYKLRDLIVVDGQLLQLKLDKTTLVAKSVVLDTVKAIYPGYNHIDYYIK